MKQTIEDFKNDLTIISIHLNLESNYKPLIKTIPLPEMVKMLIYEMFIQGVCDYFATDDKVFRAIQNIKDYCKELKEDGFVAFK